MIRYEELLSTSVRAAEFAAVCEPRGPRGRWVVRAARELTEAVPAISDRGIPENEPAAQFLELASTTVPIEKPTVPGPLWRELMHGYPMGAYAYALAGSVQVDETMRVLEVGAGVGNATVLLRDRLGERYVRTDVYPTLPSRIEAPGIVCAYDLAAPAPFEVTEGGPYDLIFGVNVMHCVPERGLALTRLHEMLADGGELVIAEGAPEVDGAPWALHWAFGLMDGWWDVGGFEPSWYWENVGPPGMEVATTIDTGGAVYRWRR